MREKHMQVRIFKQPKNPMQSGRGNTRRWVMEFEPVSAQETDPLMGWTSGRDMRQQLKLSFASEEEAVAYARKHGYMYSVVTPVDRKPRPKAYADNFRHARLGRWTH
jgi:hypothetical protein